VPVLPVSRRGLSLIINFLSEESNGKPPSISCIVQARVRQRRLEQLSLTD